MTRSKPLPAPIGTEIAFHKAGLLRRGAQLPPGASSRTDVLRGGALRSNNRFYTANDQLRFLELTGPLFEFEPGRSPSIIDILPVMTTQLMIEY